MAHAKFVGPGMTCEIAGQALKSPLVLRSPMVYVATGQVRSLSEPSLIDLALPVEASSRIDSSEPPNVPSYLEATPTQRRRYLDWLVGGRRDASILDDYVLLYLQGLERRVLVDRKDFGAVSEELVRLLSFYDPRSAFHDALSNLLLTTIWLGLQRQQFSTSLLNDAIRLVRVESGSRLATFLGILHQAGKPLTAEVALEVVARDPRTAWHDVAVIKQHFELFLEFYRRRFTSKYPGGFNLRREDGNEELLYAPINPLLSNWSARYPVPAELRLPIVLNSSTQFQPLIDLWSKVVEDLKKYVGENHPAVESKPPPSVSQIRTSSTTITPRDEACPSGLPNPSIGTLSAIVQRHTTADAWALVPIGELADIEHIPHRVMLLKPECLAILSTADRLGFALEPDARITGQRYRWDEFVSVFPHDEDSLGELASYRAASTLLRLGMTVALADGEVDEAELSRLFSHLKSQFTLSKHDTVRLDHLRYLLTKTRQTDPKLAGHLREQLDIAKRGQLGKFLVSIAAADGNVSLQERSVLEQIYHELGILYLLVQHLTVTTSTEQLQSQRPYEPSAARTTPVQPMAKTKPASLDHERIRRIEEEREKLSESLSDVFKPDDARAETRPPSMADLPEVVWDDRNRALTPEKSIAPPERTVLNAAFVSQPSRDSVAPAPRVTVSKPPSHCFDLDRISHIESETAKVFDFLRDAFRNDDDGSLALSIDSISLTEPTVRSGVVAETAAADSTSSVVDSSCDPDASVTFAGLAPRFAPFVDRIARQPTWTRDDLDRLARELGLMLGGAIDTINEWADEQFGDLLLIEEGESFFVQGELLIDNTRQT